MPALVDVELEGTTQYPEPRVGVNNDPGSRDKLETWSANQVRSVGTIGAYERASDSSSGIIADSRGSVEPARKQESVQIPLHHSGNGERNNGTRLTPAFDA